MPNDTSGSGPLRIIREHLFDGPITFSQLPKRTLKRIKGSGTLDLTNLETIKFANAAPVSYSNIKGGANGQRVLVLGDGQSTINNNAKIKTYSGGNVLLSNDVTYELVYVDTKWYLRQ